MSEIISRQHLSKPMVFNRQSNQAPQQLRSFRTMSVVRDKSLFSNPLPRPRKAYSSVCIAIPFQPTMMDEASIRAIWDEAVASLQLKLADKYSKECRQSLLKRLDKLFTRLNVNTRRKSIAIIMTPDSEKVVYLNFAVKPAVFFSKSSSLLDLVANVEKEVDFYFFALDKEMVRLYECNKLRFAKVYEQRTQTCEDTRFKNAFSVIQLLNRKHEKPVFVAGTDNLTGQFCSSAVYAERFFSLSSASYKYDDDDILLLIKGINENRDYWHARFMKNLIIAARQSDSLVTNIDAVTRALASHTDGLLLIDKHLKHQLQQLKATGGLVYLAQEFMQQLEAFLVRGNRVDITAPGLLANMGGIALLKSGTADVLDAAVYSSRRKAIKGGEVF